MKKILTVLGARPQFIKSKPLSETLKSHRYIKEVIVHTGQHYDYRMSKVFYKELKLPSPQYHLGINRKTNLEQVSLMIRKLKKVIAQEKPDVILVYGDTNSTLAGALTAKMLKIPLAHVEAGLRSFNMEMPEEVNRVVTDRISDLLFAPVTEAIKNLKNEGIKECVHLTGDVLCDIVSRCARYLEKSFSCVGEKYRIKEHNFCLLTLHREENVDNKDTLALLLKNISSLNTDIVFPLHPRTEKRIKEFGFMRYLSNNIRCIPPQSYLHTLSLIKYAYQVLTDSGGIQREAYLLKTPCVTLRNETEWLGTLNYGWNKLMRVTASALKKLPVVVRERIVPEEYEKIFGDGKASLKILHIIERFLQHRKV